MDSEPLSDDNLDPVPQEVRSKKRRIVLVEDDKDDQDFILEIIEGSLFKNSVIVFNNGLDAYEHLLHTEENPFLIICDVRLPVMNGLEFREKIVSNKELRNRNIPFIFLSSSADKNSLEEAHKLNVQGFFVKPNSFAEFSYMVLSAIRYWDLCSLPA